MKLVDLLLYLFSAEVALWIFLAYLIKIKE